MTVRKSNKKRAPRKPYPSFPLWPHGNGQWCKKIRGTHRFFGVWDDPDSALAHYKRTRAQLESGSGPEPEVEGVTVQFAINSFLTRLKGKSTAGERSIRHFEDCKKTGEIIAGELDKTRLVTSLNGTDFYRLRQRFGKRNNGKPTSPATLNGHIRRTKAIFNFAVKEGLVDRVVFGADFSGMSEKQKTQLEQSAADKILDRESILAMMANSGYRFRAMILLGLNCGMGNQDIANLQFDDLDLKGGWYETQRSKTAVRRCAKLWPETITALNQVIARRFEAKDDADRDRVFITRFGKSYASGKNQKSQTTITQEFGNCKKYAGIKTAKGAGFYSLRHTLRTEAARMADDTAIRWIMGHKRGRIDDHYTHKPPKERIEAVCMAIRDWLFGKGGDR